MKTQRERVTDPKLKALIPPKNVGRSSIFEESLKGPGPVALWEKKDDVSGDRGDLPGPFVHRTTKNRFTPVSGHTGPTFGVQDPRSEGSTRKTVRGDSETKTGFWETSKSLPAVMRVLKEDGAP